MVLLKAKNLIRCTDDKVLIEHNMGLGLVVDAIARRIAESYTGLVNGVPNGRGGQFTASMFTLDYCFSLGHRTGALPDGREAGHYIAKGIGAMTGCDRAGVTAHIASVAKLDFCTVV